MSTQVILVGGLAILMLALWVQALIFVDTKSDPPATYKLYAVRDKLIRLVSEHEIERDDPYVSAIYNNLNVILACSHVLSGPRGWSIAERQGKQLANDPDCARPLEQVPETNLPDALVPVIDDLTDGLDYLIANHFGVWLQIDARRREIRRLQKDRAKRFLAMIPHNSRKALAV